MFLQVQRPDGLWAATSSIFGGETYRISFHRNDFPIQTWDRIERTRYDEAFGHRVDAALKKSCHNHAVLGFFGGIGFVLLAIAIIQIL